jgi:hypothetical protein
MTDFRKPLEKPSRLEHAVLYELPRELERKDSNLARTGIW